MPLKDVLVILKPTAHNHSFYFYSTAKIPNNKNVMTNIITKRKSNKDLEINKQENNMQVSCGSIFKKPKNYPASGLKCSLHGNAYQLKLLMLFLFKGLKKKYSFHLATEMDAADKFDDLVFVYENERKDGLVYRFLQAKHIINESTKITINDLFGKNNDRFKLQKYFISYLIIKQNPEFKGKNSEFKDFVICTNIDLEENLQSCFSRIEEEDDILDTKYNNKQSKRFKFKKDNLVSHRKRIISELTNAAYYSKNTLTGRLAECVYNGKIISLSDELFHFYREVLTEKVIDIKNSKFHESFLNGNLKELQNFRNVFLETCLRKQVNVRNCWQHLRQVKLNISKDFSPEFIPNINVELTTGEIKKFVIAIRNTINNNVCNGVININVTDDETQDIIKDNIGILMRYVLIRKNDSEKYIYYFNYAFFDDNNIKLPGNLIEFKNELKTEFEFMKINKNNYKFHITNFQAPSLPNETIEEEVENFLDKFVFAVNQPNEIELGEIIENEIGETFNNVDKKNIYSRFQEKMLDWMKNKEGSFMSHEEGENFFEELKIQILGNICNFKNPVSLFTGRAEELKMLHDKVQRNPNGTVISQMTSVSGLGGIGKSELARKYALEYSNYYNYNVLWINAGKYETIVESFTDLAKDNKLGIRTTDMDGKEKKIEAIVKEIYEFFVKRISLFIFDNVEKMYDLNKFLPLNYLAPDLNRPFILFTSRIQEWERGIEVIKLNELRLDDAMEFVKKGLYIKDNLKDEEIKKLVKMLQCYPLALQQAISYIHEEGRTDDFEIDDYLNRYEQKEKELLNDNIFQGIDNNYEKTTFSTWQITIDKIKAHQQCGPLALQILNVISYFAPDNIYRYMFSTLADYNVQKLNLAVRLLVKYSMVKGEEKQSVLSVHRLVQQVTRINIMEQNMELRIIEKGFDILKKAFNCSTEIVEGITMKRQLLPHLELFLSHLDYWLVKESEKKHEIETKYVIDLLEWINEVYINLPDPHKQKVLLERALKLKEEHYRPDHFEIGITLHKLGVAYLQLGDPQKCKELEERALKIKKKHYGLDHIEVAKTQRILAIACGDLGDIKKRKDIIENVLKIVQKEYGDNHLEVGIILGNLGIAYEELGDLHKSKELLESALKIKEEICGKHYIDVARTLRNLGRVCGELGYHRKAIEILQRNLKIDEQHYGQDHFIVAKTLRDLGVAYENLGEPHKNKALQERALKIEEKHYGPDNFQVGITLQCLANANGTLGDHRKKKELLERTLNINEKHYGQDHFEVARTLGNLGCAYRDLGEPGRNKELQERALKINEKYYGNDYFVVAKTLENLGNAYGDLGDFRKNMELQKRALKIKEAHCGRNHFEVARTLVNLRRSYEDLGNHREAIEILERALKITEKHYGQDHFEVASILERIGMAYENLGEPHKSLELQKCALAIKEKYYGIDNFHIAITLNHLGNVYRKLGDHQKRQELLERALKIQEKHYGLDHFEVAITLRNLGHTYGDLGKYPVAYELYKKSSLLIDKQTPLHLAAVSGNLKAVEYVFEEGPDIFTRNNNDTVLHQAVNSGNEEVIGFILQKIVERANEDSPMMMYECVNAKDTKGNTPLMWAAKTNKIRAAQILLDYGTADINAVDLDGHTALHESVKRGYLEFIQLLLKNKAKTNLKDNNAKTALDVAQELFAKEPDDKDLEKIVVALSAL